MKEPKKSLIERLQEGYEVAKKPIAYIMMFIAVLLESLPSELIPNEVEGVAYSTVLVMLGLILLQVLFEIYEKVVHGRKELNIIDSNELYSKILDIVVDEKKVSIKYLGVAGRHGWTSVLDKLLNENNADSLVANKTRFAVDVALLNPEVRKDQDEIFRRFQVVESIAVSVEMASKHVEEITTGSSVNLYFYDHMPNMLGFLVNDNYLFVTYAYWEHFQGVLTLRAGGTDYFVYDKNDDFGGQEIIRRFSGWYDYIIESHQKRTGLKACDGTQ